MREIDEDIIRAQLDMDFKNTIIHRFQFFILKCAKESVNHYVSRSDDEWSIALIAFSKAVDAYSFEKGSFLPFAKKMIHNQLIDYYRSQKKHMSSVSLDQENFSPLALEKKSGEEDIRLEIEAITVDLKEYDITFMELTTVSPKAKKTKAACEEIIRFLINQDELIVLLKHSKLLPVKEIEKNTKVPRKIIERHRKYIIAAVEIISGDYPYLASYLKSIRKGERT
jgi:RNA polymerase sigma factor